MEMKDELKKEGIEEGVIGKVFVEVIWKKC